MSIQRSLLKRKSNGVQQALPSIALSCLFGVCLLHIQPELQGPIWTSSELLIFLPLFFFLFYCLPRHRYLVAFILGYLWALLFAQVYLLQTLDESLSGELFLVQGKVVDLVDKNEKSLRFNFAVDRYLSIDGQAVKPLLIMPSRLRLSWYYSKADIQSGDDWRLLVKLKPPHGMQNPHSFDYEKWLYQEGIHATGYVRKAGENKQLSRSGFGIDSIREKLFDIIARIPHSNNQGLLQALTVGKKSLITQQQWTVLRQTGTSHLMAISGLHIGLVAGMVFFSCDAFNAFLFTEIRKCDSVCGIDKFMFCWVLCSVSRV